MKSLKILFAVLAAAFLSAGVAKAQETVTFQGSLSDFYESRNPSEGGHLTFQGVEINGTLEECKHNLRAAKFRYGKVRSEPVMEGYFGKERVKLQLGTVPRADLVYVFMLTYYKKATWAELENQYQSVKMKLTSLYGQPSVLDEMVEGAYVAVISTPQGDVTLATGEDRCLRVYLVDKENSEIAQLMEEGR